MKNTLGNAVTLTLFGESHGPAIGAVLDGLAPGIPVGEDAIAEMMALRRSVSALSTPRKESDAVEILSGVYQGKTTGTPIALVIRNADTHSSDYASLANTPRPSHADYTALAKYHGYADPRGGGHFSGRLTAPIVAAGTVCRAALAARGITVGTHIARCAGIADKPFSPNPQDEIAALEKMPFAVLDEAAAAKMQNAIAEARDAGDSVGGVLESAVLGLPAGVGEPFFDTLEGMLAHAIFAIPAVKGVEFGGGFALCDLRGSEANDPFAYEDGKVVTTTNHSGGIQGGISNGMPIVLRTAIKPTPSIFGVQKSVDLAAGTDTELAIKGRHDPAIIHRARVVLDSVIALVLADALALRFGTDWLAGGEGK